MIPKAEKLARFHVSLFGCIQNFTDPVEAVTWMKGVAEREVNKQVAAQIRSKEARFKRGELSEAIHREVAIWLHNLTDATTLQNPMPADPGPMVYIARNIGQTPIYIGATRNLYRRLAAHSQGSAWWADAHDIAVIPVKSWRKALDLESRLITEHQPTGNKAGVFTIAEIA